MNGIAIVIPDVDFTENNLGVVNFLQDIAVEEISIVAENQYEGRSFTPTVEYSPQTTSQQGVTWSIESGAEYATINQVTGVVTIDENANSNNIVIKAISVYNNDVYAEKTISVKYKDSVDELNGITIEAAKIERNTYRLNVIYDPVNTSMTGVVYTITNGNQYATLNGDTITVLSAANTQKTITVNAISSVDPTISNTLNINITYEDVPSWNLNEKIGAIEGVNSGLFAAMTANPATILVQFTEDSTKNPASKPFIPFSFGGDNNNPIQYDLPYTGMFEDYQGRILMRCNALKNSGWTPGRNGGNGNNTTNEYVMETNSEFNIANTTLVMTQNADGSSSLYINDVDASGIADNVKTPKYITYLKYLTFGWSTKKQNATDYNSCSELYAGLGANSYGEPGGVGSTWKIAKFIIVSGTYTTAADVLAARENALVDIQFDSNGIPYNAGNCGTLMVSNVSDLN